MERIEIMENGIYLVFEIDETQCLKLLHCAARPFQEEDIVAPNTEEGFRFVEINLTGWNRPLERLGTKYVVTAPGYRMRYVRHEDFSNALGRCLLFVMRDEETGVEVESHIQFYHNISVMRLWHEVINRGKEEQILEYISSFNYTGIEKEGNQIWDEKMSVMVPHNSWQREMNWQSYTFQELGQELVQKQPYQRSSNLISISNAGNWSTKQYLPMGYIENGETGGGLIWQIEHNGSWHWEIGDQNGHMYLALSGPEDIYGHWHKTLKPGERFVSVPAAVGVTEQGFDDAIAHMTWYRRQIRRPNKDNEALCIIFNDYMNCLWADPTADKEFPLIDAAARAGCEYYCIDAGWYADGTWWDGVGEWNESRKRFPNGMREVTDYIRANGMIPGAWLELEVMGIHCPLAQRMPDSWFFQKYGKRVIDRSRYQLDFRNPEVCQFADSIIDKLIQTYGIGYIKMDYNIEPGIGTDYRADSVGDGLLEHERAYLSWLDQIFLKYPDLIIENCSSGGCRMDYAMLSRHSIQSTSDQDNYLVYATIAANSPTALTPEQSAIWSYPLREGDREEVVFNMINAMLLRIHQSGHLAELSSERFDLVKEGLEVYKSIREDLKSGVPFWPLGLSHFQDRWVCLGMDCEDRIYLAVWRRECRTDCERDSTVVLQLGEKYGKINSMDCIYPSYSESAYYFDKAEQEVRVTLEQDNTARLFVINKDKRK